jgi:hypothetical protein
MYCRAYGIPLLPYLFSTKLLPLAGLDCVMVLFYIETLS